jgi:hypothetical protein
MNALKKISAFIAGNQATAVINAKKRKEIIPALETFAET